MINTPIVYSGDSADLVNSYNSTEARQHADYWSQAEVNNLRTDIKNYYTSEQGFKCCYCGMVLRTAHGRVWDVEHVVARSLRPKFMFEPRNLAASCIDCNSTKDATPVLTNPTIVNYPSESRSFKILHPHFDNLEDHIAIYLDKIYTPKTKKGEETIKICGLLRYAYKFAEMDETFVSDSLLRSKSEQLIDSENPDDTKHLLQEIVMIAQVRVSESLLRRTTVANLDAEPAP